MLKTEYDDSDGLTLATLGSSWFKLVGWLFTAVIYLDLNIKKVITIMIIKAITKKKQLPTQHVFPVKLYNSIQSDIRSAN